MPERKLDIGTRNFTEVIVLDEPGEGNACHEYQICSIESDEDPSNVFGHASFQNGPIKENGVNGCHHEDLIAIVIDRLRSFQEGKWSCRENALALTKLEEALHWLKHRTNARIARGVEGTNQL